MPSHTQVNDAERRELESGANHEPITMHPNSVNVFDPIRT